MSIEQILAYWPYGVVAAGVALLLYGQRDRLAAVLARLRPTPTPYGPSFAERMEAFRQLRQWLCDSRYPSDTQPSDTGRDKAIDALDQSVLPELVKEGGA